MSADLDVIELDFTEQDISSHHQLERPAVAPRRGVNRRLVDPALIAVTLVLTTGCLALQVSELPGNPLLYAVVVPSLLPLFNTIYHSLLLGRAVVQDADEVRP